MSKKYPDKKIFVVMPAYNAEATLRNTYNDIDRDYIDEIILVDDCSRDNTVKVAQELGLIIIKHSKNTGYGGNQKTCYKEALSRGADIVVMVHPDHQYNPRLIPLMLAPIIEEGYDAGFGSRMLGGKFFEGGMPKWKFYANIALTAIENIVLNVYLSECHSGFRAYTRKYLETVKFEQNSDNFVFDTEIIVQGVHNKLRIHEIPIDTRYFKEASQVNWQQGIVYGLSILWVMLRYKLHVWGWKTYNLI